MTPPTAETHSRAANAPTPLPERVDVTIVGAGLSGIGAAARLTMDLPNKSFALLEKRESTGGTWDLFKYPGIRSDSDMFTLGYAFRPWQGNKSLADGESILSYVRDTATAYGIDEHTYTGTDVTRADWNSETAEWTVTGTRGGEPFKLRSQFLWSTTGYYDYDQGYTPELPGLAEFEGTVIHPQHWPEDLDYQGKRVVVIGSGATAVTLVPALADSGAGHVTMLQRSPTYVLSQPAVDPIAAQAKRFLPAGAAYAFNRWKNIGISTALYQIAQRKPDLVKRVVRDGQLKFLDKEVVEEHFTPSYGPWDQRLCLVPDNDLFKAIKRGAAEVVTDRIATFTPTGIRLESGRELEADIVVTATGLLIKVFGGIQAYVDGREYDTPNAVSYKALMLSELPNFLFTIGYTNASWTLKADLVAEYFTRLVKWMDENGKRVAVPRVKQKLTLRPLMDMKTGYLTRALDIMPKQGDVSPWSLKQNYFTDMRMIRRSPIDDGALEFS